jgi:hypothetical protein
MRNERRMSGSARGDEKPTAEKRSGAHRLLNLSIRGGTAGEFATPRKARYHFAQLRV